MASSSGPSRPIAIREETADGTILLPHSPQGSHPRPGEQSSSCQWRTDRLYRQECSRYFDCPSHVFERTRATVATGGETYAEGSPEGPSSKACLVDSQIEASTSLSDNTGTAGLVCRADSLSSREIFGAIPVEPFLATSTSAAASATTSATSDTISPSHQSLMAEDTHEATSRRNSSRRARSQTDSTTFPNLSFSRVADSYIVSSTEHHRQAAMRRGHGVSASRRSLQANDGIAHAQNRADDEYNGSTDMTLPRWQPDGEVTYCPICHTQFSIFLRKHHCRKCGRVVCNSCSPHRIIIPHQYIVLPPRAKNSLPSRLLLDGLGAGYSEISGESGGERVRLCNPCVPNPNTAPPQSPVNPPSSSSQSSRHRPRTSHGSLYGGSLSAGGYGTAAFTVTRGGEAYQYYPSRWRSVTMGPAGPGGAPGSVAAHHDRMNATYQSSLDHVFAVGPSSTPASSSRRHRHNSFGESTSRQRALPPPPPPSLPIAEDECPICHHELPSRDLPDYETLRESHIDMCIQIHSAYGSPRTVVVESASHLAPRRTGMYTYAATEKDCVDDAECTICLEEFTAGVGIARLECLCRFHKACILAWFVNHPGRCPVHQHDGFGF